MRRSISVTGMLCFFAGSVVADQVTLKNGDQLTGAIVKSDAKTLLIKTEFAGEVTVQWDAVSAMVSSQPLHLALKDGQTIVGTVRPRTINSMSRPKRRDRLRLPRMQWPP